jgi:anti-sigma factor RsiW
MKCSQVEKRLSAFQDGELNPQERAKVSDHLESCSACRERYAEMEKVWQALGDLKEIVPGPGFYGQLVKKINASDKISSATGFRWLFQGFSSSWATSTLLIAGILIGAYLGGLLGKSDLFPLQPSQAVAPRAASEVFSLKVFDPLPPGTLGDKYVRVVTYEGGDCR